MPNVQDTFETRKRSFINVFQYAWLYLQDKVSHLPYKSWLFTNKVALGNYLKIPK